MKGMFGIMAVVPVKKFFQDKKENQAENNEKGDRERKTERGGYFGKKVNKGVADKGAGGKTNQRQKKFSKTFRSDRESQKSDQRDEGD